MSSLLHRAIVVAVGLALVGGAAGCDSSSSTPAATTATTTTAATDAAATVNGIPSFTFGFISVAVT